MNENSDIGYVERALVPPCSLSPLLESKLVEVWLFRRRWACRWCSEGKNVSTSNTWVRKALEFLHWVFTSVLQCTSLHQYESLSWYPPPKRDVLKGLPFFLREVTSGRSRQLSDGTARAVETGMWTRARWELENHSNYALHVLVDFSFEKCATLFLRFAVLVPCSISDY